MKNIKTGENIKIGKINLSVLRVTFVMLMLTIGATESLAHSYKIKAVSIGHIWTEPTNTETNTEINTEINTEAYNASIYGSFLNNADETERLIAAQSPVAEKVLFRIAQENTEKWLNEIVLEPHKPLSLAPWQDHLWLSGLKAPLIEGESFPLTLTFLHAGTITVDVIVESHSEQ